MSPVLASMLLMGFTTFDDVSTPVVTSDPILAQTRDFTAMFGSADLRDELLAQRSMSFVTISRAYPSPLKYGSVRVALGPNTTQDVVQFFMERDNFELTGAIAACPDPDSYALLVETSHGLLAIVLDDHAHQAFTQLGEERLGGVTLAPEGTARLRRWLEDWVAKLDRPKTHED